MFGKKKNDKPDAVGNHASGLDLPEGQLVSVTLTDEQVIIKAPAAKKEYSITLDRVTGVSQYDDVEIQSHMKSSLARGIAGAVAFGLAGAVIGSQPKEKKKRVIHMFLVIDYVDGQIIITSDVCYRFSDVVKKFNELKPQTEQKISL